MSSPVLFNDVVQALSDGGSSVHAAEAHGCLCGALCRLRAFEFSDWLDEILPDRSSGDADAASLDPLAAVFAQTATLLHGTEMEFTPLLPDDDEALDQRVEALSAWCQGFLYGFGAAGSGSKAALPGDVAEVLTDVAQIARVGAVGSETEGIEESAYVELVEYLRAGTQLIYDELEPQRLAQALPEPRH